MKNLFTRHCARPESRYEAQSPDRDDLRVEPVARAVHVSSLLRDIKPSPLPGRRAWDNGRVTPTTNTVPLGVRLVTAPAAAITDWRRQAN